MLFRVGQGFDIHNIKRVLSTQKPLVLGGIVISEQIELFAHSDGDALLHSFIDSILGAMGLADIGDFFPPESQEYQDINSQLLLDTILKKTDYSKRWVFNNIDITIILQEPKLGLVKQEIKKNMLNVLGLPEDFPMAIKAKTFEKDSDQVWVYSLISLNFIS